MGFQKRQKIITLTPQPVLTKLVCHCLGLQLFLCNYICIGKMRNWPISTRLEGVPEPGWGALGGTGAEEVGELAVLCSPHQGDGEASPPCLPASFPFRAASQRSRFLHHTWKRDTHHTQFQTNIGLVLLDIFQCKVINQGCHQRSSNFRVWLLDFFFSYNPHSPNAHKIQKPSNVH